MRHGERELILCCPLHGVAATDLKESLRNRYLPASTGDNPDALRLLIRELLVFNDRDESERYDVLLVDAPSTRLTPKTSRPEKPKTEDYELEASYREGLAVARHGDRYGYVDRGGREVVPFQYDWAEDLEEGLAVVKEADRFGLIDKKGHPVLEPIFEDMRWQADNGVVLACDQEGGWRLYSREGALISEEKFDFIFDFHEGLASVRRGDKYGYIDRGGAIVIPLLYEEAYSFSEDGLATVAKKGRLFSIDTEGMVFELGVRS